MAGGVVVELELELQGTAEQSSFVCAYWQIVKWVLREGRIAKVRPGTFELKSLGQGPVEGGVGRVLLQGCGYEGINEQ